MASIISDLVLGKLHQKPYPYFMPWLAATQCQPSKDKAD